MRSTSAIFFLMVPIAPTDNVVAACISAICSAISWVARAVWVAKRLHLLKPRPASPARAASIVAVSARRFVCAAIREIRSTTSPTRRAAAESRAIPALDSCVSATGAI
jgi:hypothetical protein